MPSNTDIKSIIGSINATKSNIGNYLSLDSNMNPIWTAASTETAGENWVYQKYIKPTIVKLPKLSDASLGSVAVMRIDSNNTKSSIALLPYGFDGDNSETIMDQQLAWVSDVDNENFASIILKATSFIDEVSGESKLTWVIVNGVNTWSGRNIAETLEQFEGAEIVSATIQTIGTNTIAGGVGLTDVKFEKFGKLSQPLYTAKRGAPNEADTLVSYDTNNLFYKFNNTAGDANKLFTNTRNNTNYLTQRAYDAEKSENSKNLTNSALSFGTVISRKASNNKNVANTQWQKDNQKYCITKSLTDFQWCDSNVDWSYLRGAQWRFRVNLENFRNINGKPIEKIKHVFVTLTIANEYPKSGTYVYKVNKDFGEMTSTTNTQKNVIELFRHFLEEGAVSGSGDSTNNGTILTIPIEDNETEFDIVIESYQNGSAYNEKAPDDSNNITFLQNPKLLNIEFIGCDVGVDLSVSPDIEFDNLGTKQGGFKIGSPLTSDNKIEYAYLAATNDAPEGASYTTTLSNDLMNPGGTIPNFVYDSEHKTIKSLFNENGYYNPRELNSTISKTVIEYDCDALEAINVGNNTVDGALTNTKLIIDWFNAKWTISSTLLIHNTSMDTLTCIQSGTLSNTPISLVYYNNLSGTDDDSASITFVNALKITPVGIFRLPAYTNFADPNYAGFTMSITNYKTVYAEAVNRYYEELINYKCGWEVAENTWTDYITIDSNPANNAEQDILLDGLPEEKRTTVANNPGTYISPSKKCIEPAHRQQTTVFNVSGSGNTYSAWASSFSNDKYALLPYYTTNDNNTTSKYWAVRPIGPQHNQSNTETTININVNDIDRANNEFAANQFCNLLINPTISGTLFVNISLPFLGVYPSQLSYLIVKENLTANKGLEFVFDSGNQGKNDYLTNRDNGIITFTDNVTANNKYKYYITIYGNMTGNTGDVISFRGLMISRRARTLQWNSIHHDWRNFFTHGLYDYNIRSYPNITLNRAFGVPITGTTTSRDNEFISKLSTLMFNGDYTNTPLINATPSDANMGSVFSFHAYVLRKA